MRKKRDTRPANTIPRLLRRAFEEAEQGNEAKAREFWSSAVERGYVVVPKTEKWFERVIAKGLRDRGLIPASPDQPPTDADPGSD